MPSIVNRTMRIFSLPAFDAGTEQTINTALSTRDRVNAEDEVIRKRIAESREGAAKLALEAERLKVLERLAQAERATWWAEQLAQLPVDWHAKSFTQILPKHALDLTPYMAAVVSILYGHTFEDELSRRDGLSLEDWPVQFLPNRGVVREPAPSHENGRTVDPDLRAL